MHTCTHVYTALYCNWLPCNLLILAWVLPHNCLTSVCDLLKKPGCVFCSVPHNLGFAALILMKHLGCSDGPWIYWKLTDLEAWSDSVFLFFMGVFHRWYFVFNLSKLWEILQDRGAWHVAVLRSWRSDTTEQLNKSSKVSGCLFAVTSAAIDDHRLYPLNCWFQNVIFRFHQFSSVTQLCPTLWDPMNHSTPGLPVHHQLPEFTQTHIHQVSDAIQPSHPLSSPSPPTFNPSQHQSLFQWVNSSHEVAKELEFLQH